MKTANPTLPNRIAAVSFGIGTGNATNRFKRIGLAVFLLLQIPLTVMGGPRNEKGPDFRFVITGRVYNSAGIAA